MRRILLVHDDAVLRVAVQNLAAALGWHVDLARDVAEALRAGLTAGSAYDAAVVDGELSDGSGTLVADALAVLHPAAHVVLPGDPMTGRGPLALLDHLEGVLAA